MVRVLKIPFDLGIMDKERRGTSKAPDILVKKGVNVHVSEDFEGTQESITSAALEAYESGEKVIAVGGDHSITYGMIRAFRQAYPDSCLIILDAHSDCEDDFIPPSHEGVTRAIASTLMPPEDILLIGYRKARTKEEKEFLKDNNVKVFKHFDEETIVDATEFLEKYPAGYLSIDIDVFDPKDAPGTGWPESHGPKKRTVLNLIRTLTKNKKLKSVDLVEVSPKKSDKKTAPLATEILSEILHEFSPKG